MTSQLAIVEPANNAMPSVLTNDQVDLIKRTICKGASDDELQMFLAQCRRTGLDPFARQIYSVPRWNSKERRMEHTAQVSIDGFRLVAQRTGDYAGQLGPYWCGEDGEWKDVWLSSSPPAAAKVGILRHGFKEPCWGVARFDAYAQVKDGKLTFMWLTKGDVMIAKCAESLGLRKAFPQELSGLYTSDEMAQADNNEPTPPRSTTKEIKPPEVISVPANPANGAFEPHTLELPVKADGSSDWILWGRVFAAAITGSQVIDELEGWQKANVENLGKSYTANKKVNERLAELIKEKRIELMDNIDGFDPNDEVEAQ